MIGIVGASGFIGRSLSDHLDRQGLEYKAYLRRPGAVPLGAYKRATGVIRFCLDEPFKPREFDRIDTLVLAASTTRPNSLGNGVANEVERNVRPYVRLIEGLRDTSVCHLIYLSSGGNIYGSRPCPGPISEDVPPAPRDPYGFGKLCIEAAIGATWQGNGRRFTILRPSNPVGLHQFQSVGTHGLVTTVFHHIYYDRPITVQGDGSAVRDYFSVHDLCDLIQRASETEEAQSDVVNASSSVGTCINDVITACARVLDKTPDVRYNLSNGPLIQYNILSNQKAKSVFNWRVKYTMEDILEELRQAFESGVSLGEV